MGRGGIGRGHGRRGGGGPGFGKLPRLVEPALLYLLTKNESAHGYDLIAQANELAVCDTVVDAAAVYRVLRQMEENGLAQSDWDTSGGGPAKRVYEITPAGREHLNAWADTLRRRAQSMLDFAGECDPLP